MREGDYKWRILYIRHSTGALMTENGAMGANPFVRYIIAKQQLDCTVSIMMGNHIQTPELFVS